MDPRERAPSLPRTLGWVSVAAYGLGAILGAGVYSVIGVAAGRVGDGMWLAFLISAIVALITALAYAELATMFPRAGGEFLYVQHAMPTSRVLSFTVGAMMAVAAAATAATVAIAFGGYLSVLVDIPAGVAAPLLVAILTVVAIVGVRESTAMVALFTCIEAGGLVLVIVLGATSERFGEALATVPADGLLPGAALVFFAYLGFENIVNLAEETRAPERNLPRAILASLGGATLLYLLVALAVVALIPAADLARSDAPLADAVSTRSGALAGALGGIALFATANTAMAALISGSRILYAMARDGRLPAPLARVGTTRRTPWIATLAVAGAALALVPLGDVGIVAGLTSFASLLAFAAVNASVVVLRVRAATTPRPFHVPWAAGKVPVLSVIGAALALVLVTQLDARVLVAGAVLLGLLVGASLLPVTRRRRWPA